MATADVLYSSMRTLLLGVLLLSIVHQSSCQQKCYKPNGDEVDSLPCYPDLNGGPCCSYGWICLSNGLCSPGPGVPNMGFTESFRPDCTDSTWKSPLCFSGCNSFPGNGLKKCGDGSYCCYDMNGCACSETSLFELGQAMYVTILPLSKETSTASTTSTSASITTSLSSRVRTLVPTTTPQSTTSLTNPTPDAVNTQERPAVVDGSAIGAGVGVGLGIPLFIIVIFLVVVIKRKVHDLDKLSKSSKTDADSA